MNARYTGKDVFRNFHVFRKMLAAHWITGQLSKLYFSAIRNSNLFPLTNGNQILSPEIKFFAVSTVTQKE